MLISIFRSGIIIESTDWAFEQQRQRCKNPARPCYCYTAHKATGTQYYGYESHQDC